MQPRDIFRHIYRNKYKWILIFSLGKSKQNVCGCPKFSWGSDRPNFGRDVIGNFFSINTQFFIMIYVGYFC